MSITSSRSRSEEHTSELQSPQNLVCRLLLEKKKNLKRQLESAGENLDSHIKHTLSKPAVAAKKQDIVPVIQGTIEDAIFFLMKRRPPNSTPFPYTTLFR